MYTVNTVSGPHEKVAHYVEPKSMQGFVNWMGDDVAGPPFFAPLFSHAWC